MVLSSFKVNLVNRVVQSLRPLLMDEARLFSKKLIFFENASAGSSAAKAVTLRAEREVFSFR
jgi:hypothetical protein